MYDLAWSIGVYKAYKESCPRTEQIARCIVQEIHKWTPLIRNPEEALKKHILASIRGIDKGRLWAKYKRLCRKTPLDVKLLEEIAGIVYRFGVDESLQLYFDF